MSEYQEQALEFLKTCNATMQIAFSHIGKNENWKDNELREIYNFTITTTRGSYSSTFYDCIHHLKRKEQIKKSLKDIWTTPVRDKIAMQKEYKGLFPNEYDILACVQKYDPGIFEDFCSEYGYDEDSKTAERIYFACQKEYGGLCKIFTQNQLELLQEIN